MKFNLSQLMNEKSKEAVEKDGLAFKVESIQIEKLSPSEMNKYNVEDVAELKASIELMGLQQNLVVRERENGFEVISGHRRLKAMKELYAEGKDQFKRIPCKVIKSVDDIQAELQLILANSTTRELTDAEKTYQAARLQELLTELKKSGVQFSGRKRDIVAQLMNVSPTQVARMDSINKKLTPELKEAFSKEDINITTAYEASRLPQEQQQEIVQDYREGKSITPSVAMEKRIEVIETEQQKEKPMTHELDSYPEQYEAIIKGLKTFMCGFNNQSFRVGDKLKINEFDPETILYTGRFAEVRIIYLEVGGENGLPEDFVSMSIKKIR
ncbi:ParB N-terminal domain-containing protein [Lysinibacillus capsici]|uniref:ParB/RepB/Spo0J family partition protein n=1 Tax=Lysinibacillus capsici TaxID=2115968 RepID=UPI00273034C5|nr:ParB N-terminal domain-containing protein [Lysinibacillus capsici]MDP1395259.1 ParB N-terminal domain-containing protein [Lysinibacillus capsici]MDP1415725.1 ParB N-terminal domain-containing protein [Lysinibacillus capsici]MDP1431596.1 ParB N-terminal domain-containing protein [Lysinibacillus capsici]